MLDKQLLKPLKSLLNKHYRWLKSNATKGERLDLSDLDLRSCKFSGSNLTGSTITLEQLESMFLLVDETLTTMRVGLNVHKIEIEEGEI
jgi:hypothetical protein